jgi:hypothetical protein
MLNFFLKSEPKPPVELKKLKPSSILSKKKKKKKKKTGNLTETRILENLKNQNKRFLLEPRNNQ